MSHQVMVYSTPSCPYCHMAKDYLNEQKVAFTDINVAADPTKAQEVFEKSGQMGVPVIIIDGQVVVGFNKPELERLLQ